MGDFFTGVADALRSLAWWRRMPGPMLLGLIPAVIVQAIALTVFIVLMFIVLPTWLDDWTAFADAWVPFWATALRSALYVITGIGVILLFTSTFVALTLMVGDPFYERIWRGAELRLTGAAPDSPYGLGAAIRDGLSLFLRGIGAAIIAGLLGLIPIVGAVIGFSVGLVFSGSGLATELTDRALTHRAMPRGERRALRKTQRARLLGFGVAGQLAMMVPVLAIFAMPTLVAGATEVVDDLLAGRRRPLPVPRPFGTPGGPAAATAPPPALPHAPLS